MQYELEIERAVGEVRKANAKTVLLQLPDGLKPEAKEIADEIQRQTKASVLIWGGSCFGACDIPLEADKIGVDMVIQWGHAEWRW
jgi:2-(3-amino-3-carboxypropyl)histidine synthase